MQLVYVAGMHRSGTSAAARVLNLLGLSLGAESRLMAAAPDNARGFWEIRSAMRLNERVLAEHGGSWDAPPMLPNDWVTDRAMLPLVDEVRDQIQELTSDGRPGHVLKDPRLSFTLPIWEAVAPAHQVVLPIRDPDAVAQSLNRRNGMDLDWGAHLWMLYLDATLRNAPAPLVVDYGELMAAPLDVANRLCEELDLPTPAGDQADAIADFLEPTLDHREAPSDTTETLALARTIYTSMREGQVASAAEMLRSHALTAPPATTGPERSATPPPAGDERVLNKWNKMVRPFSAYSEGQKGELLDYTAEIVALVKEASGLDCFLAYGALLGAVRNGALVPHDDDIDMAIWFGESDRVQVARQSRKIMLHLLDRGYELNAPSYGQYKVIKKASSGRKLAVELFAAWSEGADFFLYFAVPGRPIAGSITPLHDVEFLGRRFLFPSVPEDLLAATYGDSWRVPDPHFSYGMTADKWGQFKYQFFSRNVHSWNKIHTSEANEAVAREPSEWAVAAGDLTPPGRLLEIGSGSGSDAIHFARLGHDVTATDYSEAAIVACDARASEAGIEIRTALFNLYDVPAAHAFEAEHQEQFDIVYARGVVDAVSEAAELTLLRLAKHVLATEGRLVIEFQTVARGAGPAGRDLGMGERLEAGRFVRLVDPEAFLAHAHTEGFEIQWSPLESQSVEPTNASPEVFRAVLTKR